MDANKNNIWVLAYTKQRSEEMAHWNLSHQGFESYLPRYLKTRSHARKKEEVAYPLFPRYLFIKIRSLENFSKIKKISGISHLIVTGNKPVAISDEIIKDIKAHENDLGFIKLSSLCDFFKGQKVRIINGPFNSITALFDSVCDKEKIFLLLNLFGRELKITVPTNFVEQVT